MVAEVFAKEVKGDNCIRVCRDVGKSIVMRICFSQLNRDVMYYMSNVYKEV